jgi:hypothetical protein
MLKSLIRRLFFKDVKTLFKDAQMVIVEAFTLDGVRYFMPQSIDELPAERAMFFHLYYEEFRMRCDREYLEAHNKAVLNQCKIIGEYFNADSGKINIPEILKHLSNIHKLTDQIDERLRYIIHPDHILKIASVVIWDENEHPSKYDVAYNKNKIDLWKKKRICQELLELPFFKLIAFTDDAKNNFQIYSEEMEKLTGLNWEQVLSNLSETHRTAYKHHMKK